MLRCRRTAAVATAWVALFSLGSAQEIRYYEQDGVTYREVCRTPDNRAPAARVPLCPPTTTTAYREQITTETRECVRTYWVPITEYKWEPFWVNRWNPFSEPYQAYRYVPQTRWEKRTDVSQVPVQCRRLVPASTPNPSGAATPSLASVPGPTGPVVTMPPAPPTFQPGPLDASAAAGTAAWNAPRGEVVSRVPVSGPASGGQYTGQPTGQPLGPIEPPSVARREQLSVGGVARFQDEPPRYGLQPLGPPTPAGR